MLEEDLITQFRALSQAYFEATKSPASVWAHAIKDGGFLKRVEAGGTFTARTYDKIVIWFDENWPPGAVWPPSVPRPSAPATVKRWEAASNAGTPPRGGWAARLMRQWGGKGDA